MASFFKTQSGWINRDLVCEVYQGEGKAKDLKFENKYYFASGGDSQDYHLSRYATKELADSELSNFLGVPAE